MAIASTLSFVGFLTIAMIDSQPFDPPDAGVRNPTPDLPLVLPELQASLYSPPGVSNG